MDPRLLDCFVLVAEPGSVTRAVSVLHGAPSARIRPACVLRVERRQPLVILRRPQPVGMLIEPSSRLAQERPVRLWT